MYEIDRKEFRRIMVEEQGFTPSKVDLLLADYPAIDERFAAAIEQWLESRTLAEISVHGISLKEIIENRQFHFLVAIRRLNDLLDEQVPSPDLNREIEALRTPVVFE